jgi:hypothetical protein
MFQKPAGAKLQNVMCNKRGQSTMKKNILLSTIFFLSTIAFGQTNTKKVFYNLPLESTLNEIEKTLLTDTINYKMYLVKQRVQTFTPKKKDSLFTLLPERLSINIYRPTSDTAGRPRITMFLNFGRQKSKKMKSLYEDLIGYLKSDFEDVKYEYIKGEVAESGKKKSKVDENMNYFFKQKTDKTYKLSTAWFDHKGSDHLIMLTYYKD